MKKIYITGIAGMLGGNVANILREKYLVVGIDRVKVSIPNVTQFVFDLLDFETLKNNIVNEKPDVIIHTAAIVDVDLCETDYLIAQKMNDLLTKEIADLCRKLQIKMIYISTDAVFSGDDKKLYTEDDQVFPINNYGISKLSGEYHALKNPNNLVMRTNIYGFNIQEKNSFGEWILYSLLGNKTINLFEDIYFSPILVNELATIIDETIEKNLCGLFHVCGTGAITKYNFGLELKKRFNVNTGKIICANSTNHKFKAKRALNMGMSNLKISRILNKKISTPEESIQKFYYYYNEGLPEKLKAMR